MIYQSTDISSSRIDEQCAGLSREIALIVEVE